MNIRGNKQLIICNLHSVFFYSRELVDKNYLWNGRMKGMAMERKGLHIGNFGRKHSIRLLSKKQQRRKNRHLWEFCFQVTRRIISSKKREASL